MTTAQRRKFWAAANAIWGHESELMAYSILIARYGKVSTKGLTMSEIDDLLTLFDHLEEELENFPASPAKP